MKYLNQNRRKPRNPSRSQAFATVSPLMVGTARPYVAAGGYKIKGRKDQLQNRWLTFHRGEKTATVRYEVGNEGAIWKELDKKDMVISTSATKKVILDAVERIPAWPVEVHAVAQPGLHGNAFVKPNGTIIGKPSEKHFEVNLPSPVSLSKAGSATAWQSLVATHVQGQPVLVLALCASFVGPLLELMSAENLCIDLVSTTSTGKTTALDLYASVWGAPHKMPGSLSISLRATASGIEQHALARGGTAFPADEVSLLGKDARQQADNLFEIAFMLSEGVAKERFNDPAPPRAIFSAMITSNTPIAMLLQHSDPEQLKAISVRWLSMPAAAGPGGRKRGVLDSVPKGFSKSGGAIKALKRGLAANHGHAGDMFVARLLSEITGNKPKLKRKIERYKARYLSAAGVDLSDNEASRRAELLAFVYAAGRLAAKWGVIPIKGIKAALVECYRRSTPSTLQAPVQAHTAIQRVYAYVEANEDLLVDLDKESYRFRKTKKLDALPGFLKTVKGRRCLIVRAKRWEAEYGSAARTMLEELAREGMLVAQAGLQAQTRIRKNRPKDRVYAIALKKPKK